MGRGKDKTIQSSDFENMSPKELGQVNQLFRNRGIIPNIRVRGTAVVRSHEDGNTRYGPGSKPGTYNEDKI